MEMMEDPATRKLLFEKAGFALPDLFRMIGKIDPFDAERLRTRLRGTQKQLKDLIESRTWRVARTLRGLATGLIGRH
jgi:hypothetical protein